MTTPIISSKEPTLTPSNAPISSLNVGTMMIGGRSYTVTIESSDPLVSSPQDNTKEKIEFLANLHLNHLKAHGADLSKVVIQQLDEEGLSYVKDEGEDLEQKSLPSSEVQFTGFTETNPFAALYYPSSLQDPSISNISQVYRSIIDPLIFKKDELKEKEIVLPKEKKVILPINTHKFNRRVTFALNPEETLLKTPINSDVETSAKIESHSNDQTSNASAAAEDQFNNKTDDTTNPSQTESTNIFSKLWGWMKSKPNSEENTKDMLNSEEIVERDRVLFLQNNPQAQKYIQEYENTSFA